MTWVLDLIVRVHIAAGVVGLGAFWIPILARKGGALHVRAGRVYVWCAYVVTLSAVVVSAGRMLVYRNQGLGVAEHPELYGFAGFLGYLGVTTFALVRQGLRVVATRRTPAALATPGHAALAWASIAGSAAVVAGALAAWSDLSPILLGLSPIGVLTGVGMLRLMRRPGARHMGWFYSHLGSMIGGGIAFHTAFLVFGAQQLLNYQVAGPFAALPWVLPTLVGVPAIVLWIRHYRRTFDPGAPAASSAPAGR